AFDPFARTLAWVYFYPSKGPVPGQEANYNLAAFNAAWHESAPAVADGKVVITPADSDQVHCVSLRDGRPLWRAGRDSSGCLAGVFRERVLLVGAAGARALSLNDGSAVWANPAGVPSGQGAASGNVYYLPLRTSQDTGGPGVAALDAGSGRLLAF